MLDKKKKYCTYNAPDDKGYFKVMRKAEDGEAEEGEYTRLCWDKLKIVLETSHEMKTKQKLKGSAGIHWPHMKATVRSVCCIRIWVTGERLWWV